MNAQKYMIFAAISVFALACNSPVTDKPRAQIDVDTTALAAKAPAQSAAPESRLALSPRNTKLEFEGAKVTGKHQGKFEKLSGVVTGHGTDPTTANIDVTIDMSSVKTDEKALDDHLRTADFFDVEKYPTARFVSLSVARQEGQKDVYTVVGNLDFHGVTKSISFPATIALPDNRVTGAAEFVINRKDFGVVYPGMPDNLIRDDVVLSIHIDDAR